MNYKETAAKLATLARRYMEAVTLEMEHGDYHCDENFVPYKYEDEGNEYWNNHNKIAGEACDAFEELWSAIEEFEKGEMK